MPGAVVIGAGPGIGRSVARRFARAGLPIALIARTGSTLANVAGTVLPFGVPVISLTADCTDETALRAALDAAAEQLDTPDVIVYNAALIQPDAPGDLPARAQENAWAVNVVGALTAAAHVAPEMARRGGGSFLITGGMPEPKQRYVSLSLGKAGVRTLVRLLDQEYGSSGIHVASVTVDGHVAPGTAFDPDDIAEHYWNLHTQPRHQWQSEVLYNGLASTGSAGEVLGELLTRWQSAFDNHHMPKLVSLFAEDAMFQGIGQRLVVGPAEIIEYYDRVTEGTRASVQILRADQLGEGIVGGFADMTFTAPAGETTRVRLSVVAHRFHDTWLIRQYHATAL